MADAFGDTCSDRSGDNPVRIVVERTKYHSTHSDVLEIAGDIVAEERDAEVLVRQFRESRIRVVDLSGWHCSKPRLAARHRQQLVGSQFGNIHV